ncbi:MAG: hypothetical protein ACYTEP_01890 [Planctomycetota bacterium]
MASSSSLMVDSDGDGLDDLLEVRYGTSAQILDSDGDTINDFDELLAGLDPLVADNLQSLTLPERGLRIEVYSSGTEMVLEIAMLRGQNVSNLSLYFASMDHFHQARNSALGSLPHQHQVLASSIPGFELEIFKLQIPTVLLQTEPSVAIAVKALVDGEFLADQVQLSMMTGVLMEWRSETISGAQGGGGGLFPTDPGGQMPGEVRPGEVCIQTLAQVGSLGNGQVLYQVSDSYCGFMPSAVCFQGCSASVGDSVVGIDIIGLLAN